MEFLTDLFGLFASVLTVTVAIVALFKKPQRSVVYLRKSNSVLSAPIRNIYACEGAI
jgi:hypothetical protein